MVDPVSAVVLALDRRVEKISDRAFDSAVAKQRDEATEDQPTPQEELLQAVDAGQADADAPEIREAIESELVEKDEHDRLHLTPLGKYLAPEPDEADEAQEDAAEPGEQAQATAS